MNKNLIINNMISHYSTLIKEGCRGFGNDNLSESIFNLLDKNGNNCLEEGECLESRTSLSDILYSVIDKFSQLTEKFFGANYSQQLNKYNVQNEDNTNEDNTNEDNTNEAPSVKVLKQNLEEAKMKIKNYASEHSENERINAIAASLDEVNIQIENKGSWYIAITITGEKIINFNATELENLDSEIFMKNLIHEMGHYINGDELSSVSEEVDVESFAIDITEKIQNTNLYENKEDYLKEFETRYKYGNGNNYGQEASPGYNGLPLNAGFVIQEEILSSETIDNQTIIKVKGGKTYCITWSEEKDKKGNPYPESVVTSEPWGGSNIEGITTFDTVYKNYDKNRKTWEKYIWAGNDKP